MTFNVRDWFWQIADDATRFWSSKANAFVVATDAAYLAWSAFGNSPTKVPTVHVALGVVVEQTGLLDASDTTMHRIAEGVSLGTTSWTATDVVAWVVYRRALRALVSGTDTSSTSIPAKPAYPAGT